MGASMQRQARGSSKRLVEVLLASFALSWSPVPSWLMGFSVGQLAPGGQKGLQQCRVLLLWVPRMDAWPLCWGIALTQYIEPYHLHRGGISLCPLWILIMEAQGSGGQKWGQANSHTPIRGGSQLTSGSSGGMQWVEATANVSLGQAC